ncbi:hypothetical protein EDD27_9169 [Nonomuraea polychroma]|uniref:Uncharacterized protein n=1 Tax=Nonomuraea polychroma TaxID=46176 RepID=A0A438MKR3_9ACTN|nr:hypothetical protein EDD27_9169 [Nonomuraea polychroma]
MRSLRRVLNGSRHPRQAWVGLRCPCREATVRLRRVAGGHRQRQMVGVESHRLVQGNGHDGSERYARSPSPRAGSCSRDAVGPARPSRRWSGRLGDGRHPDQPGAPKYGSTARRAGIPGPVPPATVPRAPAPPSAGETPRRRTPRAAVRPALRRAAPGRSRRGRHAGHRCKTPRRTNTPLADRRRAASSDQQVHNALSRHQGRRFHEKTAITNSSAPYPRPRNTRTGFHHKEHPLTAFAQDERARSPVDHLSVAKPCLRRGPQAPG